MERDALKDFHDGNVDAWFEEVVNETGEEYEGQMATYEQIKTGKKKMVKKKSSYESSDIVLDKDIDHLVEASEKKIEKEVALNKKSSNIEGKSRSTEECFRYLDEQM